MSKLNMRSLAVAAWVLAGSLGAVPVAAQVVINEFSAANYTLGFGGGNEDFLELYNPGATAANLAGYWLSDNPLDPQKFELPAGTTVPAGGRLTIICSGDGDVPGSLMAGGFLNTNFRVNQTDGESIVLSDPAGNVLESHTFGSEWSPNLADHSWARVPDGSNVWRVATSPTPNAVNAAGSTFEGYAPVPTFNVPAGHSPAAISLELSAPAGFVIRYTTNGY